MQQFVSTSANRRRKNSVVKYAVIACAMFVLVTLLALIIYLLSSALPLIKQPKFEERSRITIPHNMAITSLKDVLINQSFFSLNGECGVDMFRIADNKIKREQSRKRPCEYTLAMSSDQDDSYFVEVSDDGLFRLISTTSWIERTIESESINAANESDSFISFQVPEWDTSVPWRLAMSQQWVIVERRIAASKYELYWISRLNPLRTFNQLIISDIAPLTIKRSQNTLSLVDDNIIMTSFFGDGVGRVFAHMGGIIWWHALESGMGLVTFDETQQLTKWVTYNINGELKYRPTFSVAIGNTAPKQLISHAKSNAFIVLTEDKQLLMFNSITGEQVANYRLDFAADQLLWQGDTVLATGAGHLVELRVRNMSGITTFSELFESQEYAGYGASNTVWQSTYATDYSENKFSLVPLLMGSIKIALLALFVAIPSAIGAAIYTGYFSSIPIREVLKPVIETIEAIPTVLIGFIASLWLVPLAETFLFSFLFFLFAIPFLLLALSALHNSIKQRFANTQASQVEVVVTLSSVFLLGFASVHWVPLIIENFQAMSWLNSYVFDISDSNNRTTIVVALALGVAISPTIYSLAEDAISAVPNSLKHASFALGATRLNTLTSVVLKIAAPGLMAACVIGFGRVLGETMIVLMVTGNTPISSWNVFDSLRAITANLAIELPEAEPQGTHYQILLLTACLLFIFTFFINTVAEILRRRFNRYANRAQ